MGEPAVLDSPCTTEQAKESVLHDKENGVVHEPKPTESIAVLQGRIGGLKAAAIRRNTAEKLAVLESLLPAIAPALTPIKPDPSLAPARELLESHLARLDLALAKAKKASDWRDLAQARSKLFEQWAWLAGIPKPMDRPRPQQRIRQAIAEPIPIPAEQK